MADFESFMHKIGFRGFGDPTGTGKTILLSLLLGGLITLLAVFAVIELLVGFPSLDNINYLIVLVVAAVVAFFAVFWRHIPLIVLLSLLSAICTFTIVHTIASEKHTAFPAAISARFVPSEEELAGIKAMRKVRLAMVKKSYFRKPFLDILNPLVWGNTTLLGEPVSAGTIITIASQLDERGKTEFLVRYRGKEGIFYDVSKFKYMRTDHAVFLRHECALLKWAAEDADTVKDIPGGGRVTLTGNFSGDGLTAEVTHDGDTGWLRCENLKM